MLLMLTFFLVGCGSSKMVKQPIEGTAQLSKYEINKIKCETEGVPEHFLSAVQGHLKAELSKRSLLSNEANSTSNKVDITVVSYRMRSGFSRMMFGVFAGKDGIESTVKVLEPATGKVIGESNVSSFNVTAVGNEDDIARMHAQEIAKFLAKED